MHAYPLGMCANIKYPFKNLVFEGGGVKGVAYLGALQELCRCGVLQNTQRVAGTSAGAITALLLGLKYNLDEIYDIIFDLNFSNFTDDSFGFLSDSRRLFNQFGWYKGKYFHNWARQIVAGKLANPDANFEYAADQDMLDMHFIGTNISTGYSEIYSAKHTPKMRIADAVRVSMSIPLVFAAMKSAKGDILVDGGAINNYPLRLFDQKYSINHETLGFRLDSTQLISVLKDKQNPQSRDIKSFKSYMMMLVDTLISAQDNAHLKSDDWKRTVYIDCLNIRPMDFEIGIPEKKLLIKQGQKHARQYLDWYAKNI